MMALLLITAMPVTAQVLWSDDFESYPTGALSNDPTGQTPGQGEWYVKSISQNEVMVMTEPNKGNVVGMGKVDPAWGNAAAQLQMEQRDIKTVWDSRNNGNDILLMEYDVYIPKGVGHSNVRCGMINLDIRSTSTTTQIYLRYVLSNDNDAVYFRSDGTKSKPGKKDYYTNFPYDTWISIQLFADYNAENVHIYIPKLNINNYNPFPAIPYNPYTLFFGGTTYDSPQDGVKYDNISLSAISTLPAYLSVNDFVSSKFTIFPNPVTDIVTITNNENIGVEQIKVFDISGKTVKSLRFNNENEVQLNLGDFASGMYLLHIKTNEGTAVKKVVKK